MTNPTSNFGWQMPTPTDLVTDLPADFEVFGQAVDTDFADLLGGTTGQILSKASATDLDFTWITNDVGDITAVTVTAPITGGGTSGSVGIAISAATTSASGAVQLSDSTSTTSSVLASTPTATKAAYDLAASAYAPAFTNNFYAGKNKIINGKFDVWQRGTTFDVTSSVYNADRFLTGNTGNTGTISQQAFTLGAAPVSGYEAQYFLRANIVGVAGAANVTQFAQRIEDVRSFAGQTVTISYWAKADAAKSVSLELQQYFGSGGSASVNTFVVKQALTTSWVRYTSTIAVPSISGKTIGTGGTQLDFRFFLSAGSNFDARTSSLGTQSIIFDIWGVQIEAGSVATPFQTASGSIGGELALCQRYLPAISGLYSPMGGYSYSTTNSVVFYDFPVTPRVVPTGITISNLSHFQILNGSGTPGTPTSIAYAADSIGTSGAGLIIGSTVGSPTLVAGQGAFLRVTNSSGSILFTGAEL